MSYKNLNKYKIICTFYPIKRRFNPMSIAGNYHKNIKAPNKCQAPIGKMIQLSWEIISYPSVPLEFCR